VDEPADEIARRVLGQDHKGCELREKEEMDFPGRWEGRQEGGRGKEKRRKQMKESLLQSPSGGFQKKVRGHKKKRP